MMSNGDIHFVPLLVLEAPQMMMHDVIGSTEQRWIHCYGLCLCCIVSSPPSRYFLVFDRLSNDVVQGRYWWFGRGGTFIRTLPALNVELIVGSGLRWSNLLKLIVKTVDHHKRLILCSGLNIWESITTTQFGYALFRVSIISEPGA